MHTKRVFFPKSGHFSSIFKRRQGRPPPFSPRPPPTASCAPALLLSIKIILSSNKIQVLQKEQILNYFVKRKAAEFEFLYFTSSLKKYGKYLLLSSQSS